MMKFRLFIPVLYMITAGICPAVVPEMPIPPDMTKSLAFEWAGKVVHDSVRLSDMETLDNWQHEGFGVMELSDVYTHQGKTSLLLTSPTKGEKPGPERGRPFGACNAIFVPENPDLTEWNRISFWIYPDMPGFKTVSLCMILHNEGEEQVPDAYERNGFNYKVIENKVWNRVYWEIEHLGREKVTGIELHYRLQGNEPGATDTARYYFDDLQLQKVDPDYYEGWSVAPGHIAYSHSGYANGFKKIALSSDMSVNSFSLVDNETGIEVLSKKCQTEQTDLGTFIVLDFTEWTEAGKYILKAGNMATLPFMIGGFADVFHSSIMNTINHFYCQRCGTGIEGIHAACHLDWMSVHGDQSLLINGGWHDAGDLSQGLGNTSESTYAMLALAKTLQAKDPELADRLLQEAKWGLDWMLKTRFGDGFRNNWGTMDFWTDGIIGTVDDVPSRAWNNPHSNYVSAGVEALAAMLYAERDPDFSAYTRQCAIEDWAFAAIGQARRENIDLAAAALNSSLILLELTGDNKYKDKAIEFGDYLLSCQQLGELSKSVPLQGFFYSDPSQKHILHYEHIGREQDIVRGLVGLCEQFPDHVKYQDWHEALLRYTGYYKTIIPYSAPWNMIPAGLYDIKQARDDTEKEQICNGVKLDNQYYIKHFPVWKTFRGNCGTVLSQTKGLSVLANYLNDRELQEICYQQLQWVLGMNPFCQSLMYGEGYRFADQYSAMSGNITGGLPVGIQTHFNRDEPYWPAENCYNWKEIWVHPSGRWLWIMSDFMN